MFKLKNKIKLKYYTLKGIALFFLLGLAIFNVLGKSIFSNNLPIAASLQINKTVNNSTPLTGETFIYTLQYRCASLTDNCTGVMITDPLPASLEYISLAGSSHTISETYNSGTHTCTFTFQDPLIAGTTGQVLIWARFPNGTTPNGTVASNTATISGTNAPSVNSTIDVTAVASANPIHSKRLQNGGSVGGNTTYYFQFCNNDGAPSQNGTLTLENIVIRDTLPVGSIYVQNDESGTTASYDPVSHVITFTRSSLAPGECLWPKVTVNYPNPPFSLGTNITNNAYFSYTAVGESRDTLTDDETITIIPPDPRAYSTKTVSSPSDIQGGSGSYRIVAGVNGTEDMADFCINDTIPTGIEISAFSFGGWYYGGITGAENILNIYYTTNLNGPTLVPGSPFSIWDYSTFISVQNDLGLTLGGAEYITSLNYCFGDVPAGFSNYEEIVLNFNIPSTAPVGIITNCAELSTSSAGFSLNEGCVDMEIRAAYAGAVADPWKSFEFKSDTYFHNIGDTIEMHVRAKNDATASLDFLEPTIYDLLPPELSYIPGTWTVPSWSNPMGAPIPIFTETPNYNGTGRTLLQWSWTGAASYDFSPGDQFYIYFDVILNENAIGGNSSFINEVINDGGNINYCWGYEEADINDLDNDGNTTELICTDSTHFNVTPIVSLESEKLVKGQLDTTWTKYPETGYTVPGGLADFQLIVRNRGNVLLDSIIVIDILPFVGDEGVIDLNPRNSRWRPNLVGAVDAPPGVTVYYSAEGNPCRSIEGIVPSGPVSCTAASWTIVPPADITTVQSLKFDFGATVLNPNDSLVLEWPMRAPVNALATIGSQPDSIAWNSFGYIGQRTDNSEYLLATEPIKVGISMNTSVPAVIGDYAWIDLNQNGRQNGGEPGYDGMRVELFKDNGDGIANPAIDTFVNFTATANGGFYLFPYLPAGDYFMVFYKPAPYGITTLDAGGNDAIDSDGVLMNYNGFVVAVTEVTNLSGVEYDLDWDLGIYANDLAAIGNYVWADSNADGIQNEPSSAGLNGVTVNLYDNANPSTIYATDITANDVNGNPGYYLFDQLSPGDYFVEFVLPASTTFATQGASGSSDPTDSDVNTSTGRTEVFSIAANVYDDSWDAALILTGVEVCANGIDDDLDGQIDEGCVELCNDGIDNDGDGYSDCFDPDCPCYAPILCDGKLYQTIAIAGEFWLYEIETNPVSLNPILNLTSAGVVGNINNAYYNTNDGFIYFLNTHAPHTLYRVNGANAVEAVGNVSGFPTSSVNAAGNDNSGNYYFRTPSTGDFYLLDTTTLTANVICDFPATSWPQANIGDFAYNPINDKFYGTRDSSDILLEIDLNTCSMDTITMSAPIQSALGAFFISAEGIGYGYANSTGDFYQLNLATGEINIINTSATTSNTDGCSCSTVIITKAASADSICLVDTLTYSFTVFNQSGAILNNLNFADTLPPGFEFASNPYNINGIVFSGSPAIVGDSSIELNISSIATGVANSFDLDVIVSGSISLGTYTNQAQLKGLPPFLPPTILSDDPSTIDIQDSTGVVIRSCPEICDNGVDDDGDGGTDCFDSDCGCLDPELCYMIADGIDGANSPDTLYSMNPMTGAMNLIGLTGTYRIESMALDPVNNIIYACSGDTVGIVNETTGLFTPIPGGVIGNANGALGIFDIDDIDGLTYDTISNILWASERRSIEDDLLFQIDPSTGQFIANAFGAGVDYLVVVTPEKDIDDLAVGLDGTLYAISNEGSTGNQRLGTIDKITGVFTLIGDYGIEDVEGLTFSNTGQLLATTGNDGDQENQFYSIDYTTAESAYLGSLAPTHDVEACACRHTSFINGVIGDFVWADLDANGQQDPGEPGVRNVRVNLLDKLGVQISTTTTNLFGFYQFTGLASDSFIVEVILPSGASFTSQDTGSDITDSDVNIATGRTGLINLVGGLIVNTTDAGLLNADVTIRDCNDNTDLFVADASGNILRFEDTTGILIDTFIFGMQEPNEMLIGPDNYLYVSDESLNEIRRYSLITGALIDVFATGLNSPNGLTFGSDGNLYVNNRSNDEVLYFDPSTGNLLGTFVLSGSGGLDSNRGGLVFGPDGNLYVTSRSTSEVLRYNGSTGVFIDAFVSATSGGLSSPRDLTFGPDGNLYVSDTGGDKVLRYDGITGAFIDTFIVPGLGGLDEPFHLSFGANGNLYVSSNSGSQEIIQYDGSTGALIGSFANGLTNPTGIYFAPVPGCPELCGNGIDDDLDGLADCDDPDCIISPSINTSINTACINEVISIAASDAGTGATYNWTFGTNANPTTATGIGPHNVSYSSCGNKTITVSVLRNGCSLSIDSIISVVDVVNPVWDIDPQDLILECNSAKNLNDSISLWLNNYGYGSASDNCNSFRIIDNYSGLSPDCGSTASTSVQFTAIDSCGNSAVRIAGIQILDTQAPEISSIADITAECDELLVPPSPTIVDSCDVTPDLAYQEVVIQHPYQTWKSTGTCILLYEITSGVYDDKATATTIDDEMTFTITVIGQNTGTGWSATANGTPISGEYYKSYQFGPLISNGSTLSFSVIDDNDASCIITVEIDAADF